MRQVILRPGEDGYIIAESPSLPSCITQGETEQHGDMIPEDSHLTLLVV